MNIERISAFSNEGMGGNPAGVVLLDTMLEVEKMQNIAAKVGYSETVLLSKKHKIIRTQIGEYVIFRQIWKSLFVDTRPLLWELL